MTCGKGTEHMRRWHLQYINSYDIGNPNWAKTEKFSLNVREKKVIFLYNVCKLLDFK